MKKVSIILFFLIIFQIGCSLAPILETAIAPITTGVIAWNNSQACKYYDEEAPVIYRSLKSALKELDHKIKSDVMYKDGSYYIIAGGKDSFKIEIKKVQSNITEVKIRVNLLGDKPYAELIYKKIDSNLDVINFDVEGKPTKFTEKINLNQ